MKKINIKFSNIFKNKLVIRLTVLFLLAAILIASFFWVFDYNLNQNLKNQAENYLTENGSHAVNALNTRVDGAFSPLTALSSYIAEQPQINGKDVLEILHEQTLTNHFSSMAVFTPEGNSYSLDALSKNVKDRDYFQLAMKGKNAVSNILTSRADGELSIVFAVPIYKNNKIIGVLCGIYRSELLTDLLDITTFNGNGRILLIQSDGTTIIGSSRLHQGSNYFDTMKGATMPADFSPQRLAEKIRNEKSCLIQYSYQGESDYASYLPVRLNNWYIVSIVPSSYIQKQSKQILGYVLLMAFEIVVVLFLAIFYIVYTERKNAKKLFDSNQQFEALAANIPGGLLRCSTDNKRTLDYVSDGCLRLFGCTRQQFTEQYQNKFKNIIYEKDRAKTMEAIRCQMETGHHVMVEFRIVDSNGNLHWVFDHGRVITEHGNEKWEYLVLTDITKDKATQEELRQSFERYRIVMEQSDSVIYEYNLKNNTIYVSDNFKKMFGYELPKDSFIENLRQQNIIHSDDKSVLEELYQQILNGKSHSDVELRIRKIDGTYVWCKVQATTIFDDSGIPAKSLAKITDIDEEKEEAKHLLAQAQHDPLTGMFNKATVQTLIDQHLKTIGPKKVSALLVLDLDHFKQANDTYGHLFGDSVLIEMSLKIKKLFRSSDIIGRVGGDEFVVFLKNIGNEAAIADKSHEICENFKTFSVIDDKDYKISGSIGIAVFPKDGSNYLELFKKADKALYHSKNHGKDGYTFYNDKRMVVHNDSPKS